MELWLFTRSFPEGSGEAFLESALPVWAQQFEKVRVIPMFRSPGMAALPDRVEVVRLWDDPYEPLSGSRTLAEAVPLLRAVKRHGASSSVPIAVRISHARQLLRRAELVRERLVPTYDPARVVLLSAWMEDWVNVLGLVKERVPALRYATMAHGWDLFEHRRAEGTIPYRGYQMQQVDRVICIAASGRDHLRERYPEHGDKVFLEHLGTRDHGPAPWAPAPVLRLVSCSYLRQPKRIDRLADALLHVRRAVHWTHFGDGPLRSALDAVIERLPEHVAVDLKGNVSNAEVLQWYRNNPADLFMHCSDKEGLPISLMEAASFGIPLVANDVGGVSEVVHARTGVLLPAQADPTEWARLLDDERTDRMLAAGFRAEVRKFWKEVFSSEDNYRHIGSLLINGVRG